jgi:hypothetical protein
MNRRYYGSPIAVHTPDLIIEVAAAEDVKDGRVDIACLDEAIGPVLGAVLQTHTERLIVLEKHILDPVFIVNLTAEFLIVFSHPENGPLRSSDRYASLLRLSRDPAISGGLGDIAPDMSLPVNRRMNSFVSLASAGDRVSICSSTAEGRYKSSSFFPPLSTLTTSSF